MHITATKGEHEIKLQNPYKTHYSISDRQKEEEEADTAHTHTHT